MALLSTAWSLTRELSLAILAPPSCAACDVRIGLRTVFCAGCAATVECARPDAGERAHALAAFAYGGAMADAIVRFKYESRPDLARPLADLLRAHVARALAVSRIDPPEWVVPVPLHPARLADRGYNQAALLARPVARAIGAELLPLALERTRDTARQASLAQGARASNVAGAFVVRARCEPFVRGRRVLLVDDVCTTGATLEACASALRTAGASVVWSAVVARAER